MGFIFLLFSGRVTAQNQSIDLPPKIASPYYTSTSIGITKGDTIVEAVQRWWEIYREYYNLKPKDGKRCTYILRPKDKDDVVANVKLANGCYGGVDVYGTPSCPTGYEKEGSLCKAHGVNTDKNPVDNHPIVAQSVSLGVGNTFLKETDYIAEGSPYLYFSRRYASRSYSGLNTVSGWRWTYSRRINFRRIEGISVAELVSDDGVTFSFVSGDGVHWRADPDITYKLSHVEGPQGESWWEVEKGEVIERYGATGKLLSIKNSKGQFVELSYYPGSELPKEVVDNKGAKLKFYYEGSLLKALVTPDGQEFWYVFDSAVNLVRAYHKASSESELILKKRYLYNDEDFIHHLTGVSDAKGRVELSWSYDSLGRVKSAEREADAVKYTFSYNENGSTSVSQVSGGQSLYFFEDAYGVRRLSNIIEGEASVSGNENKSTSIGRSITQAAPSAAGDVNSAAKSANEGG
ncbi:DUF6531 domain-containing protein [Hahella sp. NBU794]|uniref:DUF6531 domain-containing protein n=1 Tax=Hahella sp. NBU794 TaxID=3422590 RepID=UPI003D6F605B